MEIDLGHGNPIRIPGNRDQVEQEVENCWHKEPLRATAVPSKLPEGRR